MRKILTLKNGETEVITKDRHFSDLLRKYIGSDAADYYENRIKSLLDEVDEMKELLDDLDSIDDIINTARGILSKVKYE